MDALDHLHAPHNAAALWRRAGCWSDVLARVPAARHAAVRDAALVPLLSLHVGGGRGL